MPAGLLPEPDLRRHRVVPTPVKRVAHGPPTLASNSPRVVGNKPCCWPIGEPSARDFRFCDSLALIGKPYCDEHVRLAYRRIRRRDGDNRMAAAE
jgi:GcrA cell cycle regulator